MKIYSAFILLFCFNTASFLLHGVNWRLKNNFSQRLTVPEQQIKNSPGFNKTSLLSMITNPYYLTIGGLACLTAIYQKRPDLINAHLFYTLASAYILDRSLPLLHELGHAGMIKMVGGNLINIEISPLPIIGGGTTGYGNIQKNKHKIIVSMAGPITGLTACWAAYNILKSLPPGPFNTKLHLSIIYWAAGLDLISCFPFTISFNPATFKKAEQFGTDGLIAFKALKKMWKSK